MARERPADRLRDLQPAARGNPARDRRDGPVRHQQLDQAADAVAARDRLALQHAQRGAACRPGRSAARASTAIRAAAQPAQHALPVLRGQAGHVRRARLLRDRRRVPARRGLATTASASAAAASRRPTADGPRRCSAWPASRSATAARPAMHNAALAELGLDWLYLPAAAARRTCSRRRSRRCRPPGFRGPQRDRAAQGRRARAWRTELSPGGGGDRRREHADLRRRHRTGDNTDAGGLPRRARRDR